MAKTYNHEKLENDVFEILGSLNAEAKTVKALIAKTTGFKKTKVNELYNQFVSKFDDVKATVEFQETFSEDTESISPKAGLKFGDRYTYNAESDQYVVYLKAASRNVVIPGDMHRNMLKAYSNWNGSANTINEMCRNFSLPRKWFEEYKTIMGWSHDHEPISNEELLKKDVNSVVEDLLQQKRFNLYQEFQKRDWTEVQKDAEKWREFQAGKLDPFESFIDNLEAIPVGSLNKYIHQTHDDSVLLVGLSDIHCGGLTEARYITSGKEWNLQEYEKAMDNYLVQLSGKIQNRVNKPGKIVVVGLGDIMHGLTGTTVKGTPLICDRLRDTQFDAAFSSLVLFISKLGQLAPKVEVHTVTGNHEGWLGRILFKTISAYFRNDTRVTIDIADTELHAFKVLNTLVLCSHGASAEYKAKIPKKGKARESYIQSYLLSKPEMLLGVTQKVFLCGDLHSFEHEETNDFEYYRFSTMVPADAYAEALNLHSRPRQNCLIIDNTGISESWHIYF